jgi:hypothetical protein
MLAKLLRSLLRSIAVCIIGPVLLSAPLPAAATVVANVTALVGSVAIQSAGGTQRLASVGADINNGDTIETAAASEVVMVFTDHQRVYLKAGTVFRVDDFNYAPQDAAQNHSFMSLVKGGLRVLDGAVAKLGGGNSSQLKTQTSTIGIRGTEYSVTDCGDSVACVGDQIVVYAGEIVVSNAVASQIVRAGEGAIVPSVKSVFKVVPADRVRPVTPSAACQ